MRRLSIKPVQHPNEGLSFRLITCIVGVTILDLVLGTTIRLQLRFRIMVDKGIVLHEIIVVI